MVTDALEICKCTREVVRVMVHIKVVVVVVLMMIMMVKVGNCRFMEGW